ncbi:hypothetical protein NEOLEDRAFT_1155160 [Neolentinus lepideus HHB14362 ss-1]|uniref:Protein-S-isoprenylcysteine O-methyltransferase n=1 Tax=Neolentinus lepideus HHB14362 ss-1 TaxID=1314782 RepID=A0A165U148_9AGAM|nr:hypothetical protein NEOLEDRAFT_1155160 [Neolentinus lepideus HHB14362 ss-1]
MLTAPMLKIPFILSAALAFHVASTSPNPTPSPKEMQRATSEQGWGKVVMRWVPLAYKVGFSAGFSMSFWMACIYELVAIATLQTSWSTVADLLSPMPTCSNMTITSGFLTGWFFILAGGFSRYWCYRTLGRHFTFELTIRDGHQLVTSGPYTYVRHPSYTGMFFALAGTFLLHFSAGSWMTECGGAKTWFGHTCAGIWGVNAAFLSFLVIYRTGKEDEMLRAQFGRKWDEWAERVSYRLVPYIY